MKRLRKNPEFVRRFRWLLTALTINRRQLVRVALPKATPKAVHALYSKVTNWEAKELEPPRDELLDLMRLIVIDERSLSPTVDWLLAGGETPRWLRGRVPEGGAIVPNVSAPSRPGVPSEQAELEHPTPARGAVILDATLKKGARARFDELARAAELKRLRGEPLSDLESELAALWPRLRQAIEAAEFMLNEAEGTRTPNHRIDRLAALTFTRLRVLLRCRRSATPSRVAA